MPIVSPKCGESSSQNVTYLSEASDDDALDADEDGGNIATCSYKICKATENICRIKLDFRVKPKMLICKH
jgi:hypothetical protein